MYLLCRFKQGLGAQGFLTSSYLGKEVARSEGVVTLEKVCAIYEVLTVAKNPETGENEMDIGTKFYTQSQITNGQIPLNESDCLFIREVEVDDEILIGYHSTIEKFRLEKMNIQKANSVPTAKKGNRPPTMRGLV